MNNQQRGRTEMDTINDFSQLDWLLNQVQNASPSAEDEYFTRIDEQTIYFPTGKRFTRTVHYHTKHHTITKTESVITNLRRNSVIHFYTERN